MWISESIILMLLLYFTSILLLSLFKPTYIEHRKAYLFRCLFPSWKFYEDLCYEPILFYRSSKDGVTFDDWQQAIKKIPRNWRNFFVNPKGNLIHAYNSLLLQVESDKEDFSGTSVNEFSSSVSYQLAKNLAELLARENNLGGQFLQFKLTSTMQGNSSDYEDTLISLVHKVQ